MRLTGGPHTRGSLTRSFPELFYAPIDAPSEAKFARSRIVERLVIGAAYQAIVYFVVSADSSHRVIL